MVLSKRHSGTVERREFASEIKFLVPRARVDALLAWAREHLDADPNGTGTGPDHDTYGISSLYFDTKHFDVFHGRDSFGRSKYRVRRYNGLGTVFLERKTKTRDWVSKRRSLVDAASIARLKASVAVPDWPGFWFHRRLLGRHLHPVCQISYVRTARIGMAEGHPVRLTLDRDLRASARSVAAFDADGTGVPLLDDAWILELKYRHALPAVFKRLITEFAPAPQRLSKYRLAVTALHLAEGAAAPRSVCETEDASA
jgi:hypothetical protein